MSGILYVVATPIGNLGDITKRALEILESVDIIACENRDRHIKLLNHYNIKKRLIEYSPANEKNSSRGIVKLLLEGKNIALVSDAGAPGLSDPGAVLVEEARRNSVKIVPVPGASALTTLLSVSGLPFKRTVFIGFLPKSPGHIEKELKLYKDFNGAVVFFANQRHVKKILELINKIFGNVDVIIGREMTKMNEEYIEDNVLSLIEKGFDERGEFTILIYNRLKK
ncbi:MAG: 16S rRNA (cytidine(1402)-2'-O)-methyltransferase [Brevinematales bacterium]